MANPGQGVRQTARLSGLKFRTVVTIGTGRFQELVTIQQCWPGARIVGADPQVSGHSGYDHVQKAVAAESGQVVLYGTGKRASLLKDTSRKREKRQGSKTVDAITLECLHQITQPWLQPTLLRVDTEGSEYEIIASGIPDPVAVVSLEVRWAPPMRPGQPSPGTIQRRMTALGFSILGLHSLTRDGKASEMVFVR